MRLPQPENRFFLGFEEDYIFAHCQKVPPAAIASEEPCNKSFDRKENIGCVVIWRVGHKGVEERPEPAGVAAGMRPRSSARRPSLFKTHPFGVADCVSLLNRRPGLLRRREEVICAAIELSNPPNVERSHAHLPPDQPHVDDVLIGGLVEPDDPSFVAVQGPRLGHPHDDNTVPHRDGVLRLHEGAHRAKGVSGQRLGEGSAERVEERECGVEVGLAALPGGDLALGVLAVLDLIPCRIVVQQGDHRVQRHCGRQLHVPHVDVPVEDPAVVHVPRLPLELHLHRAPELLQGQELRVPADLQVQPLGYVLGRLPDLLGRDLYRPRGVLVLGPGREIVRVPEQERGEELDAEHVAHAVSVGRTIDLVRVDLSSVLVGLSHSLVVRGELLAMRAPVSIKLDDGDLIGVPAHLLHEVVVVEVVGEVVWKWLRLR
mmetsp:Transcript_21311/g.52158  ORF Transcript_21311/g.52158 Transcript_21311/m.52158 type:complete len:430 (-) Transcript_21311:222-1511(-)